MFVSFSIIYATKFCNDKKRGLSIYLKSNTNLLQMSSAAPASSRSVQYRLVVMASCCCLASLTLLVVSILGWYKFGAHYGLFLMAEVSNFFKDGWRGEDDNRWWDRSVVDLEVRSTKVSKWNTLGIGQVRQLSASYAFSGSFSICWRRYSTNLFFLLPQH